MVLFPVESAERDSILRGCDPEQAEAITTPAMPLRILASAGSGKTRALTRRIAWRVAGGEATAAHVLALTFTRKAAGELRGRLEALGVPRGITAGTFHGVAFAQLRQVAADRGRPAPVILESKVRLLAELVGSTMRGGAGGGGRDRWRGKRDTLSLLAGEIEWAKARLVRPGGYVSAAEAAERTPPVGLTEMAEIYERYERQRQQRKVLDFEDLLTTLARAIESDHEVASTQRWRFRHFFVDEFQDVNPAQLSLLDAWLGDRRDICIVGDPDQSIYGWNGSDPAIINTLERRWPELRTVRLGTNYRSTPQVIALAAAVLPRELDRTGQPLRPRGAAHRGDGPVPTITQYRSDIDEAESVAAALRRAHRPGRSWSQLAVLARTNAQLTTFEQACAGRGIPFRVAGLSFLQRPAVRRVVAGLTACWSAEALSSLTTDLEQQAGLDAEPDSGGEIDEEQLEQRLDLAAVAGLCREYLALDPTGNGADFNAWLRSASRGEPSPTGTDAVELATFHRAKGLEWPVVFATGLERGLVPIAQARDDAAEAEERRLLYVALKRAEDELHCSWASQRRWGKSVSHREPSPYLDAIERARTTLLPRQAKPRTVTQAARSLPTTRARPAADEGPSGQLAEAMRNWRSATARGANVPAYVVMPDKTLDAIVAARPDSIDALLRIPGIGPSRAASYGDTVLRLVKEALPD